ncbi:MAG TPA: carbonic anhydrase [Candidatus Bathyarchaeia archaeon]|nr:carbonic anhydrase [Candidatus Bathyarchaeia archaeon]
MKDATRVTPAESLARLKAGHERFLHGHFEHPHCDSGRRTAVYTEGQRPWAAIIGCSDSRVPVEVIFDQGIGDLFVVRVAGNVCNGDEIASIEYAVEHLGTPLCVVLGHTRCGAVTSVVTGAALDGHLAKLVRSIYVAAEDARREEPSLAGDELVDAATRCNVRRGMADLTGESGIIAARVDAGTLQIAGAIYDLATGAIDWI